MQVIINYSPDEELYKLYNQDLDLLLTSEELFKLIVMFNSVLMETYGGEFNVLKSDEIDYIIDSYTMRQMIVSNVNLLKRLNRQPSAFQESANRFNTTSTMMTPTLSSGFSKQARTNESIDEFDKMNKTRKGFSQSKFRKK